MRTIATTVIMFILMLAIGCSNGMDRTEVYGRVTFKGQPVNAGTIHFLIANRPAAMGRIENGTYRITHHGGVPVGSGKVQIEAFENTTRLISTSPSGVKQFEAKQVLPAKYNTITQLLIEVPTDSPFEKNFDLDP